VTTRTMAASCGSAARTSASRGRRPADLIGSETGQTLGKPGRVRPRLVAILEPASRAASRVSAYQTGVGGLRSSQLRPEIALSAATTTRVRGRRRGSGGGRWRS
jgi:hypothetical protein